ncbi:MAG: altronate dehydratase, partial [Paenibacillaceae bacterium]|nr:altronate dehydratase [Paenibacillaceae bacterium]
TAIERASLKHVKGSIDAVAAFPHPYGCSQMGDDQEFTRTILADLINHPNAGGVLVLGLGCENSNITELKRYIGEYDERRVKFLVAQESEDEISDSLELIDQLAEYAGTFHREPISCSELVIGMKCGGSDGLSGITANPTVGEFSDMLVSKGGTTILTEVPEMFGAETLLMNRCQNEETFEKTVDLINDFKNYFTSHNQTIYENPSPGNKKGGISTLEDKSLGCVQKSGRMPVVDVLKYGEPVRSKGLNLLSAPGNDLVASTALAASGAHIVLFTTGRGTPFACPVPTMKISTNSALSQKKNNWIDFNCGVLVEGTDMETLKNQFFDFVIEVASGKMVKSEEAGFHDMAIFKQGVTL